LMGLLRTLPQTLVVATHDLALVEALLPRMVVMEDGAVVADGPTRDLLSDRAFLERHGLI
ncbi:MAG TPA: cobalt ABC transporter ATP-binding protein, partial [Anaerolineaceae bacterium]|nr:cobalt ABC transporter ATP-binding protein [Anaerolineaceae bacterium]